MRSRPDRAALRHVAVIQTAFVGDVLLTMPLMAALRAELADATLTLVTTPAGADAVGGVACIDHVVVYDKRGVHRDRAGTATVARAVGAIDALIVLHKSYRTARLMRAIAAPFVVTYKDAWARWWSDVAIPYPRPLHDADRHLRLLQALLPEATWTKERCVPIALSTAEDRHEMQEYIGDGPGYVVVAPGSAWPTKQWPLHHVQALASGLVRDGYRCVVLGDRSVKGMISGNGVIDLSGRTTMRQAAAVVAHAKAVVANDSAPLHLASLQGIPVVGIFGPTVTEYGFGPFGRHAAVAERVDLACRPCSPHGTHACPVGTHACMRELSPDMVRATLDGIRVLS